MSVTLSSPVLFKGERIRLSEALERAACIIGVSHLKLSSQPRPDLPLMARELDLTEFNECLLGPVSVQEMDTIVNVSTQEIAALYDLYHKQGEWKKIEYNA